MVDFVIFEISYNEKKWMKSNNYSQLYGRIGLLQLVISHGIKSILFQFEYRHMAVYGKHAKEN